MDKQQPWDLGEGASLVPSTYGFFFFVFVVMKFNFVFIPDLILCWATEAAVVKTATILSGMIQSCFKCSTSCVLQ